MFLPIPKAHLVKALRVIMEDSVKSQRIIIFFLWKEGSKGSEIARRLQAVFGDSAEHLTFGMFGEMKKTLRGKRYESPKDLQADLKR